MKILFIHTFYSLNINTRLRKADTFLQKKLFLCNNKVSF
jgi:hypothetical protein